MCTFILNEVVDLIRCNVDELIFRKTVSLKIQSVLETSFGDQHHRMETDPVRCFRVVSILRCRASQFFQSKQFIWLCLFALPIHHGQNELRLSGIDHSKFASDADIGIFRF